MSKASVERRLRQVAARLRDLREELDVTDEQLAQLSDVAEDARLRALVSETPLSSEEHRQAERHVDTIRRHRAHVAEEIAGLEGVQDELLDKLLAEPGT
jgi:transcriptional regulator with XRE-family HTH domain